MSEPIQQSDKQELIIFNTLRDGAGDYANAVAKYQWQLIPDAQLAAARQALTRNSYIIQAACNDPEAVKDALYNAAVLGVDLTDGKRQGWLVPRKNQYGKTVVTLQVGYKGVEAIHQRLGVIDHLTIRVVRQNDDFEWSGDDQEKPKHKANWFDSDEKRGPIVGVFSITYFPNASGIKVAVAGVDEIFTKHRDRSDSYKTYVSKKSKGEYAHPPPWVSDEKSMVEKTMAFIAAKQWPANIRDDGVSSKILETLHSVDVSDYSRFTVDQRDIFTRLFEARDSLGMWLFARSVDIEIFAELTKTFPKGKKTEYKNILRDMERIGSMAYALIVEGLNGEDDMKVMENLEGCEAITIKALRSRLDKVQLSYLDGLLSKQSQDVPQ